MEVHNDLSLQYSDPGADKIAKGLLFFLAPCMAKQVEQGRRCGQCRILHRPTIGIRFVYNMLPPAHTHQYRVGKPCVAFQSCSIMNVAARRATLMLNSYFLFEVVCECIFRVYSVWSILWGSDRLGEI